MSKLPEWDFLIPIRLAGFAGSAVLEIGSGDGIDDAGGRLGNQGENVSQAAELSRATVFFHGGGSGNS